MHECERSEADEGYILAALNTTYSKRRIILTAKAVDALHRHRIRQKQERLLVGETWEDLDLVFLSQIGTVMIPDNLTKRGFKRILATAGLPDLPFHCLAYAIPLRRSCSVAGSM